MTTFPLPCWPDSSPTASHMLVNTVAPGKNIFSFSFSLQILLKLTNEHKFNCKGKEDRLQDTDNVAKQSFLLTRFAPRMRLQLLVFHHLLRHLMVLVH